MEAGKLTKSCCRATADERVHGNARPDGPPGLPRTGQQEEHHRDQRRGAPLLPPQGRRTRMSSSRATNARKRRSANEEARIWISGLEAVKAKIGVKAVYDLSATPFFLRGSGYAEGTLFPWVVSDFSLIDAIESGIVKVPRVPVADDAMTGEQPTYRDIWVRIREALPKKGRRTEAGRRRAQAPRRAGRRAAQPLRQLREVLRAVGAERRGPCQGADAARLHRRLQQHERLQAGLRLHRRLGEEAPDGSVGPRARQAAHLQQRRRTARWTPRPNTILIDSEQLESGEAMSDDFKKIASVADRGVQGGVPHPVPGPRCREPDRRGSPARGDEHGGQARQARRAGRCVVSVSMLTEGWDANTVTHILGRARLRHAASLRAGGRAGPSQRRATP